MFIPVLWLTLHPPRTTLWKIAVATEVYVGVSRTYKITTSLFTVPGTGHLKR
jgi:hypothetical protein